jgi:tRNA uridine 5-carbamoylmethylation protein Kti12
MSFLIILRGSMGSGKTKVSEYLRRILEDSDTLDLDLNANGPVENLDKVLGKKNVVAELYMVTPIKLNRNGLANF